MKMETLPARYEIRIATHLSAQWIPWFEGLAVQPEEDGNTVLSGLLADQAALHGVLKKIRDLGIPLLSVVQVQVNESHPEVSE